MLLDGCPKQCEAYCLPFVRIAEKEREVSLGSYCEDTMGVGVGGTAVAPEGNSSWTDGVHFEERQ